MKKPATGKPHVFRGYDYAISEVKALRGRDAEHFIKIFRHESDNVTGASLGLLLGVFEIDDHSEESKYIVNFLFSVAKNEYFSHPKRGAVESFEATLHKINVALAEIVKHGNTAWLGKFHGAIAVLEQDAIHLSVTGDGHIYLIRDSVLSPISAGLASLDAAEHPIKTFVEISSGQLKEHDRLLFILPKAVELLGEEALTRNARHMSDTQFAQFLRTAMVNELSQSGALIVDIQPKKIKVSETTPPPSRHASIDKNYFSSATFEYKQAESISTALAQDALTGTQESAAHPEYIDTKTGHIYIKGQQDETPIERSRFAQYLEDFFHSGRAVPLTNLHSFHRLLSTVPTQSKRLLTVLYAAIATARTRIHTLLSRPALTVHTPPAQVHPKTPSQILSALPAFQLSSRTYLARARIYTQALFSATLSITQSALRSVNSLFHLYRTRTLPKKRFVHLGIGVVFISFLLWVGYRHTLSPVSIDQTPPPSPLTTANPTREQESLTADLPTSQPVLSYPDTVAPVYLNDTLLIVTKTSIEIPETHTSLPLPSEIDTLQSLAPMPDLNLLFLLTQSGALFSFSPTNHAFTRNTLPTTTPLHHIGAYLTYLYALSADGTELSRFPRTNGGFGEGTSWFKTVLPQDHTATFSVNDTLLLFSQATLTQYSHGKSVRSFDVPVVQPDTLLLASEPDTPFILGLDSAHARLIVWDTEGHIIQQYFSDTLAHVTGLALHNHTVALTTTTDTVTITLP